jgi:hypothetical protein
MMSAIYFSQMFQKCTLQKSSNESNFLETPKRF